MTTFQRYLETSPAPDLTCIRVAQTNYTPRELAAMEAAGEITNDIQSAMQPFLDEFCGDSESMPEPTASAE